MRRWTPLTGLRRRGRSWSAVVEIIPVDDRLGRRAGVLLARSGTSDVVDASVICLAQDGDDILTSDPADLLDLARASGAHVGLIPV